MGGNLTGSSVRGRTKGPTIRPPFVALVGAILLNGCAYSYIGADGARHVFGFVDLTIKSAADSTRFAGDVVDVTTIGASYMQTPQGGSITLGYSRNVTAALRDNAFVTGDPLTASQFISLSKGQ
jgi:hypothetical protein